MHAVAGPERKEVIDRLQAVMALIEGHAEHVMDAAGADVLPSLPKLRESLERRRREKPPLVKLLERLLGLDLKMRQYEVGKRFCDAVVGDWGIEGLNRAWSGPGAPADARRARRPGRLGPQNICSFCNTGLLGVYKHVFAWYASREQD